jgi:hypothetical protein
MEDENQKALRVSPSQGVDAISSADLRIVANFLAVKKHSWRGKYKVRSPVACASAQLVCLIV